MEPNAQRALVTVIWYWLYQNVTGSIVWGLLPRPEGVWRRWGTAPHTLSFVTRKSWVVKFISRLPYPWKGFHYPRSRRLVGPQSWSRRFEGHENLLPLPAVDPRFLDLVHSLFAISQVVFEEKLLIISSSDLRNRSRKFQAHSRNWDMLLSLRHVCLSVCPSDRMEQLGFHWTDLYEIWYFRIVRKYVEKIQVLLRSNKNNG